MEVDIPIIVTRGVPHPEHTFKQAPPTLWEQLKSKRALSVPLGRNYPPHPHPKPPIKERISRAEGPSKHLTTRTSHHQTINAT